MIEQDLYIKKIGWKVRIYYAVSTYYADEIITDFIKIGVSGDILHKLKENLWAGKIDSGFTYSNLKNKETVMIIGLASSGAEYANSIDHEKLHLIQHILEAIDIDPKGEEICYISGELARDMHKVTSVLICQDCLRRLKKQMNRKIYMRL